MNFRYLLQKSGWLENVSVETDAEGRIVSILPAHGDSKLIGVPAFRNSHSHAFQYAMAGFGERQSGDDDFWTWRDAMYRLALGVDPDQMEIIATVLYGEMRRHGYAGVTEFHYLHHDKEGRAYANPAEMGARLVSAAQTAGIAITLVPVFYKWSGFGKPALSEQKRFISDSVDDYLNLLESSKRACDNYELARCGFGVHSMRAASTDEIREILATGPLDAPFHIHISEQRKEVSDAIDFLGSRPVRWFLDNVDIDERFNFVHATHMTEDETVGLAKTGANVVICPSTEGNLGDGFFDFGRYSRSGGVWSIGTDSHVGLNPFEELRLLDYGQRLLTGKRGTFGEAGANGTIAKVFDGGMQAEGQTPGEFFEIGKQFDACVLDSEVPLISARGGDRLEDTLLYSSDISMQRATIVAGNQSASDMDSVRSKFADAVRELLG